MSTFAERVYRVIRLVPPGRVLSYASVAGLAGRPGAARGVGRALRALPEDGDVPWWRIVNRDGAISIPRADHAARLQRALLEDEGVEFDANGRIDLRRFGWIPDGANPDPD